MSEFDVYNDPDQKDENQRQIQQEAQPRLFNDVTNSKTWSPPLKPASADDSTFAHIAYIFQELDGHLAYEISSRVLSTEFSKEWPEVHDKLLRELHLRLVFDKNFATSVPPFCYIDPTDVKDLRREDLRKYHPYTLNRGQDEAFYKANPKLYPWHTALFAALRDMGIKLEDWVGIQTLRGPEFGPRVIPPLEPIKVEVREWRNVALGLFEGVKEGTLEHCYKRHTALAIKDFQKWCLNHGWKRERGVWMPGSFGMLPVLWLDDLREDVSAEIAPSVRESVLTYEY
ncbi:hypothetical protein ABW21_db0204859 [Orbilia brochopaga]|nr:hypothetical protein ABW21_db0204859 [Drechslerella brochopaga]